MTSQSTLTLSDIRNRCAICGGSAEDTFFRQAGGYPLVKCGRCGLIYMKYIKVRPEDFILSAKKDSSIEDKEKVEFWSFPELFEKHKRVFEHFFGERLKRIIRFKPPAGEMLDIGSGYGFWMKYCKDRKLSVEGMDISHEAAQYACDTLDLNVHNCDFDKYSTGKRFGIITLCDVLEHCQNPGGTLRKCREFLSPKGVLYIQVPNVIGFRLPLGHGLGLPYHYWQFSPSTLKKLLRANGFEPKAWWTGVQGVIGAYERGGPNIFEKLMWTVARSFRVGNRLQILAIKDGDEK